MKDINFPIINSVTRKSLKQLLYKDKAFLKKLIRYSYMYIYIRETFNRDSFYTVRPQSVYGLDQPLGSYDMKLLTGPFRLYLANPFTSGNFGITYPYISKVDLKILVLITTTPVPSGPCLIRTLSLSTRLLFFVYLPTLPISIDVEHLYFLLKSFSLLYLADRAE